MSIRLRLTLLYSAILALTLLIFDFGLYWLVANQTLHLVDEALESEELRVIDSPKFRIDHIDYTTRRLAASETFVQTRSLDGQLLDRTANLGEFEIPMDETIFSKVSHGYKAIQTVTIDGERLRVYSKQIRPHMGSPIGILQVGRSLADYDRTLATLRQVLIIGSVVGTIIAFGFGWLLAGTALDPIASITQGAQTIGRERSFDRRVSYTGPNDELGRLARTINGMLEELRSAYQNVDNTLQAQRRFVADASHELRTPLTTIRGNLELLRHHPPIQEEDRSAVITDMVSETDRLIRLVNDLLVLARTDAGYRMQRTPVAVRPLVEELCRQAQLLDPGRLITCDPLPDATVFGDRDAIKQALLIFIDNALKYSEGPVNISVVEQDGQVSIRVEDSGPGVDPSILPSIFDRFYRADESRTGGGSGLGLAIARAVTEAQEGQIQVESIPGRGSSFSLTLKAA